MKPSEILRKAKALIDTPEKWTQKAIARESLGIVVKFDAHNATRLDSLGALARVDFYNVGKPIGYLNQAMGNIVTFNDTHTHAEVMAKWDEAIALAEADENVKT